MPRREQNVYFRYVTARKASRIHDQDLQRRDGPSKRRFKSIVARGSGCGLPPPASPFSKGGLRGGMEKKKRFITSVSIFLHDL